MVKISLKVILVFMASNRIRKIITKVRGLVTLLERQRNISLIQKKIRSKTKYEIDLKKMKVLYKQQMPPNQTRRL